MSKLAEAMPLLLTSEQAARLLGMSRRTFNRWVSEGRIPQAARHTSSYGGHPRYSRTVLEQFAANPGEWDQ